MTPGKDSKFSSVVLHFHFFLSFDLFHQPGSKRDEYTSGDSFVISVGILF